MMNRNYLVFLSLFFSFNCCGILNAHADWPEKPVHIIVPYPPGGTTDIVTRLIGQKLSEEWKQPVIIENKGGGAAMIGTTYVAKSVPDGYTLLSTGAGPHAINISLFPKIPYDPVKDFAPISMLSINPLLMMVPKSVPVSNVGEYIAWIKANPKEANYCSIGSGSPSHLAAELFKSMAGLEMTHIPYTGSGTAIIGVLAGTCSIFFDSVLSSGPQVRAGNLKVLATGNKHRLPSWPDVPTLDELGFTGYEAFTWGALLAPQGTPIEVIRKTQFAIAKAFTLADVKKKFEDLGAIPTASSPQELASFTQSEIIKWGKIIKSENIKPD
jgi:tripartite-type tricarboxylate transporter receptor subunit TctC